MVKPVTCDKKKLAKVLQDPEWLGTRLVFKASLLDLAEICGDSLPDLLAISESNLKPEKHQGFEEELTVKLSTTIARVVGLVEKCNSGYWCLGDTVLDPRKYALLYASEPETFSTLARTTGVEDGYVKVAVKPIPADVFEKWYHQYPRPIDATLCEASYDVCPSNRCYENAERAYQVARMAYWKAVSLTTELARRLPGDVYYVSGKCSVSVSSAEIKSIGVSVRISKSKSFVEVVYSYPNITVVMVGVNLPAYQPQSMIESAPHIPEYAVVRVDTDFESVERDEEGVADYVLAKLWEKLVNIEKRIVDYVARKDPAFSHLGDFLARADGVATAMVYHTVSRFYGRSTIPPATPKLLRALAAMRGATEVDLESVAEVAFKLSALGRLSVDADKVLVDGVVVGDLRLFGDRLAEVIKLATKARERERGARWTAVATT